MVPTRVVKVAATDGAGSLLEVDKISALRKRFSQCGVDPAHDTNIALRCASEKAAQRPWGEPIVANLNQPRVQTIEREAPGLLPKVELRIASFAGRAPGIEQTTVPRKQDHHL